MGKERDGSDDRVDGRETVGNSLGRAPLGRSEMEAMTGWEAVGNSLGRGPWGRSEMEATRGTEGKPWGIAWGELRSEGAGWKGRQGGGELR